MCWSRSSSNGFAADLLVTFIKDKGATATRTYRLLPNQRFNINTAEICELTGFNFSTIVEVTNAVPVTVESAIYWNVNGVIWEGGGNTVATRLPLTP